MSSLEKPSTHVHCTEERGMITSLNLLEMWKCCSNAAQDVIGLLGHRRTLLTEVSQDPPGPLMQKYFLNS